MPRLPARHFHHGLLVVLLIGHGQLPYRIATARDVLCDVIGDACVGVSELALTNGDATVFACGSLTSDVLTGSVVLRLGSTIIVTVPAGSSARVTETGDGTFIVENVGDGGTVDVDNAGQVTTLDSGQGRPCHAGRFEYALQQVVVPGLAADRF